MRLRELTGTAEATKDTNPSLLAMVRDTARYADDGGAGYADTGWTPNTSKQTGGYLGDYRTRAAGTGSHTATWTFSGLEVGASYRVAVTWKALSTNASNAPYTVLDGATAEGTVAINQRVAPDDLSVADVGWESLGLFTVDSGTLAVRLSNLADGTVMADGVRIFRVYPGFPAGSPLQAAGLPPAGPVAPEVVPLTADALRPVVDAAIDRWAASGATAEQVARLRSAEVRVADLGSGNLGMAYPSVGAVVVDDDAAGWGWFVDPTPLDNAEFTTPDDQGEQDRMDLVSVLTHEFGHLLGHDHDEAGVMAETLEPGVRLAPAAEPAPTAPRPHEAGGSVAKANSVRPKTADPIVALFLPPQPVPATSGKPPGAGGPLTEVPLPVPDRAPDRAGGPVFDAGGDLAVDYTVNTTTDGFQARPDVTALAGGQFVVGWSGNGTGGYQGVFVQRYGPASGGGAGMAPLSAGPAGGGGAVVTSISKPRSATAPAAASDAAPAIPRPAPAQVAPFYSITRTPSPVDPLLALPGPFVG